jgi:membrane peptidoglycan carboxypeptidase
MYRIQMNYCKLHQLLLTYQVVGDRSIRGSKPTKQCFFRINQAVETNRDFGSTMKPITDYAPAFENGVYSSTADISLMNPTIIREPQHL